MANGTVVYGSRQYSVFIYEGEDLAVQYPDGTLIPIPRNRIHTLLSDAVDLNGEPCKVVPQLTPISRLPIVSVSKDTQ